VPDGPPRHRPDPVQLVRGAASGGVERLLVARSSPCSPRMTWRTTLAQFNVEQTVRIVSDSEGLDQMSDIAKLLGSPFEWQKVVVRPLVWR